MTFGSSVCVVCLHYKEAIAKWNNLVVLSVGLSLGIEDT